MLRPGHCLGVWHSKLFEISVAMPLPKKNSNPFFPAHQQLDNNASQSDMTEEKAQEILNDLKQKLQKNFSMDLYFNDLNTMINKRTNKENVQRSYR